MLAWTQANARATSARTSAFGLRDLVEFRYDLAVGDQVLSADELAELAALVFMPPGREVVFSCYRLYGPAFTARVRQARSNWGK